MPKIAYIDKRFSVGSLKIIEQANSIITEYKRQGDSLTLRQLYYRFVTKNIIANKQSEYKRLGSIINDARMAGHIDWNSIEDRTRHLRTHLSFDSIEERLRVAADNMRLNPWEDQENYLEVWIEKDALVGVLERVCGEWRVPYFACRGNNSQSEQWRAGQRLAEKADEGKRVHVLYLGDHDPTGIDISRDNQDRLTTFSNDRVELHRLALNMDQVEEFNPMPNPVKEADSRASGYIEKFGESCWELDALEPATIRKIIEKKIFKYLDRDQWDETLEREEEMREKIREIANRETI